MKALLFALLAVFTLQTQVAFADYVLTQNEDAYDPFVDYSEFEEASEEEADINFFRSGRFFTLNFLGGYRQMTERQSTLLKPSPVFGVGLVYFFDLRFAMQVSYVSGDHTMNFTSPLGTNVRGTVSLQELGVSLKYYFNTQNVTKGLANLNPYFLGGFSSNSRTTSVNNQLEFGKDTTTGFDFAAGIEIPMLRNKMFFGAQATYKLITWPDENQEIIVAGTEETEIFPTGDVMTFMGIIGVNF